MHSHLNAYKKNQINTASNENLVLMLYDGARKFISLAIRSLENEDIQEANHNLVRSQDILSELMSGINFGAGQLAQGLFAVYEYMHYRLIQANVKKDIQYAEEVLAMIDELRSAWIQILKSGYAPDNINVDQKNLRIS